MSEIILSIDLGKAVDYTAGCILRKYVVSELNRRGDDSTDTNFFEGLNLKRYPLGTDYTDILDDLNGVLSRPQMAGATVVFDRTGVGVAILDFFRKGLRGCGRIVGISLTDGKESSAYGNDYNVPKRDLIDTTVIAGETGRLHLAEGLENVPALIREMMFFDRKISDSGHVTLGSWRQGSHDDMTLALCQGIWFGEQKPLEYHFYGGSREDELAKEGCMAWERKWRMKNKK